MNWKRFWEQYAVSIHLREQLSSQENSACDNVWTPDIFHSILPSVRSINTCPVTMSEGKRAAAKLQTNTFIARDDIESAIHLQIQYYTADKHILYWRQTLLAYVFHAGDGHVSAGD